MQEQNPLNDLPNDPLSGADAELEAALGKLSPARAMHSPEQIAFEAGRRAGRRTAIAWRGMSIALAAGLALAVALRPAPRVVDHLVYVPSAPQFSQVVSTIHDSARESRVSSAGYLSMRDQVLSDGPDVLRPRGALVPLTPVPQAMDVQPYGLHIPRVFGGNS